MPMIYWVGLLLNKFVMFLMNQIFPSVCDFCPSGTHCQFCPLSGGSDRMMDIGLMRCGPVWFVGSPSGERARANFLFTQGGVALRRCVAFGRRQSPTTNLMRIPVGTGRCWALFRLQTQGFCEQMLVDCTHLGISHYMMWEVPF